MHDKGLEVEQLDINNRVEIDHVVSTVLKRKGKIDLLINNAGYALIGPTVELSDTQLRSQLETNVLSQLALIRAVAPSMKKHGGGKVINIGSMTVFINWR